MTLEALSEALRASAGLAVELLLPVCVLVVGLSGVVSALLGSIGVRDQAIGLVVRALAVVLALGLLGESMLAALTAHVEASWSGSQLASEPERSREAGE